jgi:hypothetical protein
MTGQLYNYRRSRNLIGFPTGHPDLITNQNYIVQENLKGGKLGGPKKLSAKTIAINAINKDKVYIFVSTA